MGFLKDIKCVLFHVPHQVFQITRKQVILKSSACQTAFVCYNKTWLNVPSWEQKSFPWSYSRWAKRANASSLYGLLKITQQEYLHGKGRSWNWKRSHLSAAWAPWQTGKIADFRVTPLSRSCILILALKRWMCLDKFFNFFKHSFLVHKLGMLIIATW